MAKDCPFCELDGDARIVWSSDTVVAIRDQYPVTEGHTLVIPRGHVASYFDATPEQQAEIWRGVEAVKAELDATLQPDGYNVGFNAGAAAGQTVMHLHVHVIPRRSGDMQDPRGGVRGVIPHKQKYGGAEARLVVGGSDDPLLKEISPALDGAEQVDVAIAFVFDRGVDLLHDRFVEVLRRGGRIRVVTGRYQDVTEPAGLRHLLSLPTVAASSSGSLEVRAYRMASSKDTFHPKAWMVRGSQSMAWVGSSNLSQAALQSGIEWNYRLVAQTDVANVQEAFEALWGIAEPVDKAWIAAYEKTRRIPSYGGAPVAVAEDAPVELPEPRPGVQREALLKLTQTRLLGNEAGMVVLATGLGKTYLSAFDSRAFERVLFIAHREEILSQAAETYRKVRPDAKLGRFDGKEKQPDADLLFASIQTLTAGDNLEMFSPEHFDYIVVDEFHHAAAETYRRVLDYFEPQFLLGLTATPERLDGMSLLALCQGNEVYRADIPRGIVDRQLSPFHYFGIGDDVKYEPIPWRSYSEDELTNLVATEARAEHTLKELRARTELPVRALGFCVTQKHADFMRAFCTERGVKCASVHAGPTADARTTSLEQLAKGELEIVFCVDMFNEGVDVPSIDTVLMLRPTQSTTVWLQQLGRGLRYVEGKTLTVLDFIGNHVAFLRRTEVLLGALGLKAEAQGELWDVARLAGNLPAGVRIEFDLHAQDILQSLREASKKQGTKAQRWYRAYREAYGARPSALVAEEAGYRKQLSKKAGWLGFAASEGDLDPGETAVLKALPKFFAELEALPRDTCEPMLILGALLGHSEFPGRVPKKELAARISKRARRSARLMRELGTDGSDPKLLLKLLNKDAFTRLGRTLRGRIFEDGQRSFACPGLQDVADAPALARLMRELVEQHLERFLKQRNKSATQLPPMRDGDRTVDARLDVEERDGLPHVIFHSRGEKRNSDYREGLTLLLRHMHQGGFGIARIDVDSTEARKLTAEARTLAVDVADLSAPETVALAIGRAAKKVGQPPGANGGNDTKRLRIVLAAPVPAGELWQALWGGGR